MKPFPLHGMRKARAFFATLGIATFFTLTLQFPAASYAAPLPPPKTTPNQYRVFLPGDARDPLPLLGSKKGVGMPYPDCADAEMIGAVWQYSWSPQPADCPGVDNVPMIWGRGDVTAQIGGNSEWLMGFNEPDLKDQANITIPDAIVLWQQIEQKYPDRKLVAPAPSYVHPAWIIDFRDAYIAKYGKPPRFDALAMHCYHTTARECIQLAENFEAWARAWGVTEIWVTEFAFLPCWGGYTSDQAIQEGQAFINWMENETMITRMAWFASRIQGTEPWATACNTPLIDWDTRVVSAFGEMYGAYQ